MSEDVSAHYTNHCPFHHSPHLANSFVMKHALKENCTIWQAIVVSIRAEILLKIFHCTSLLQNCFPAFTFHATDKLMQGCGQARRNPNHNPQQIYPVWKNNCNQFLYHAPLQQACAAARQFSLMQVAGSKAAAANGSSFLRINYVF